MAILTTVAENAGFQGNNLLSAQVAVLSIGHSYKESWSTSARNTWGNGPTVWRHVAWNKNIKLRCDCPVDSEVWNWNLWIWTISSKVTVKQHYSGAILITIINATLTQECTNNRTWSGWKLPSSQSSSQLWQLLRLQLSMATYKTEFFVMDC